MTSQPSTHQAVIAAALEHWWITTDPLADFDFMEVAQTVETHLINSGSIAPDTGTTPMPPPACEASHTTPYSTLGPCTLRDGHNGPVHKDATGATWWTDAPAPPTRTPSIASIAFTTVLALACTAGGIIATIRDDWFWAVAGGLAAILMARETADELNEHRQDRT
ncbi:hypothetical protein ACFYQA_17400 [Streptomyces sp. NPDC005774]|uniref:hypothetical protein n=1 Tax=Streptomyces sp. NPDC005774 TaxID=3364728 RepID=UPI0036ADCAE9